MIVRPTCTTQQPNNQPRHPCKWFSQLGMSMFEPITTTAFDLLLLFALCLSCLRCGVNSAVHMCVHHPNCQASLIILINRPTLGSDGSEFTLVWGSETVGKCENDKRRIRTFLIVCLSSCRSCARPADRRICRRKEPFNQFPGPLLLPVLLLLGHFLGPADGLGSFPAFPAFSQRRGE